MCDTIEVDFTPPAFSDDEAKLAELILHIAIKSEGDPRFGAIKLNKLLFFADLDAHRRLGRSVTGTVYQRLGEGPAPRRMKPVLDAMVSNDDLARRTDEYFGYPQHKFFATREPDLSAFSGDEIAIVGRVVDQYWEYNATQISHESHKYQGYKLVGDGEDVPLGPGLLGDRDLTEQDLRIAKMLEPVAHRWLDGEPLDSIE